MSTKITAENGAEIEVGQLGITVTHPEGTASIWARLTPEQRRALVDVLHPGRQGWSLSDVARSSAALAKRGAVGQWTRDDLPEWVPVSDLTGWGGDRLTPGMRDALVAHLNAHHPKPDGNERDEAVSFAYWVAKRLGCHVDKLNGLTLTEMAERVTTLAEQERENWRVTAVNRAAAAVTVEGIVEVIRGRNLATPRQVAEAVMSMLSSDDPAVYVVWESDITGVEAKKAPSGDWAADGIWTASGTITAERTRESINEKLGTIARREAVARAIEAEQALDPVSELAAKLEEAARDAVRVTVDAMKSALGIELPFTPDDLLSDVDPDYWQGHAREVLRGDGR